VGHVALCSHFLILLAFWLYVRPWSGGARARVAAWTALVAVAAFVHPYLWLMLLALSIAALVRYAWIDRVYGAAAVGLHAAGAIVVSAASAWVLGWLTVGGREDLTGSGLGDFSMNVLGPIASSGISSLVPALPVFDAQVYEGLNYLGAGALLLSAAAIAAIARRPPARVTRRSLTPLIAACTVLAIAALSPRVTLGRTVIVELPLPDAGRPGISSPQALPRSWFAARRRDSPRRCSRSPSCSSSSICAAATRRIARRVPIRPSTRGWIWPPIQTGFARPRRAATSSCCQRVHAGPSRCRTRRCWHSLRRAVSPLTQATPRAWISARCARRAPPR
jgi:hypothetical protein